MHKTCIGSVAANWLRSVPVKLIHWQWQPQTTMSIGRIKTFYLKKCRTCSYLLKSGTESKESIKIKRKTAELILLQDAGISMRRKSLV